MAAAAAASCAVDASRLDEPPLTRSFLRTHHHRRYPRSHVRSPYNMTPSTQFPRTKLVTPDDSYAFFCDLFDLGSLQTNGRWVCSDAAADGAADAWKEQIEVATAARRPHRPLLMALAAPIILPLRCSFSTFEIDFLDANFAGSASMFETVHSADDWYAGEWLKGCGGGVLDSSTNVLERCERSVSNSLSNSNCLRIQLTNASPVSHHRSAGMANAALERGVTIQYCLPSATDMLQSLSYPSVVQARASEDYVQNVGTAACLGARCRVGGACFCANIDRQYSQGAVATHSHDYSTTPAGRQRLRARRIFPPHGRRIHRPIKRYTVDGVTAVTADVERHDAGRRLHDPASRAAGRHPGDALARARGHL